ncbi:hypothetical protein SUGI_0178610 [Cryptomeria japonica]|uniref:putative methylesterase 15, chloroplastic n=1 Tax=Cryptomeria japonica TaxID=3369 RepID=UPI002408BD65|nr:putative methylesterase 15, chloroplastic [Cryptomeria japonica]GLJ11857.1 hypothetical protein SUGI_0178610 [Cryptomeria japonica]
MNQQEHFVLIHGLGHGAWCWYKVVAMLQRQGHRAVALDLTSNGINREAPAHDVKSLAQYAQPLLQYISAIPSGDTVIVVGHSLAGSVVSYAMERYPHKIAKAIFIASFMPLSNQSYLASSFPQVFPRLLVNGVVKLNYSEGKSSEQPISASFNLDHVKDYLYNESSEQDVSLSKLLLTSTPYSVAEEVLHLTPQKYGSVQRFFVKTEKDKLFLPQDQDYTIEQNPPERVFPLEGSDHSPFFSQPLTLCNLLQKIASL